MLLGCIADDFTGATDLANTLTRRGMHTVQTIGLPRGDVPAADAIVVALKSRTIPAADAVAQSIAACRWLKANGARQIFFKYCSTFDSTDAGNIGPVADALLDELGAGFTIACPAFPENKRTIYLGHLFVANELLSDSSMRNHPLTPMRDANLVRVLGRQTPHKVGLVSYAEVKRGSLAIADRFAALQAEGVRHAIVDAVADVDLENIGAACMSLPLVTGGSGVALGLPANFVRTGRLKQRDGARPLAKAGGLAAVLAGSCSAATLAQVAAMRARAPAFALDPMSLHADRGTAVAEVLAWAASRLERGPILIHSTAEPEAVSRAQAVLGREAAGALVEESIAAIARDLVARGVRRLVVAGGETSGAVVSALGVTALEIGPQIAPGVPATLSYGEPRLALALKSGNFGGPEFFTEALEALK
ncbi:MAG: four-carbon acid sugar kinase family protein [Alphaproteobacteria bacterium]|nr:four-carbon acid sugar kinase family protein [Alphaproteobacteria bacterium]